MFSNAPKLAAAGGYKQVRDRAEAVANRVTVSTSRGRPDAASSTQQRSEKQKETGQVETEKEQSPAESEKIPGQRREAKKNKRNQKKEGRERGAFPEKVQKRYFIVKQGSDATA